MSSEDVEAEGRPPYVHVRVLRRAYSVSYCRAFAPVGPATPVLVLTNPLSRP